jgi:superoxide dismutase, Fe-Mn family
MEGLSVTDTVISTASHERDALAFNYASQALNNSFFLECLVCCVPLYLAHASHLHGKATPTAATGHE